MVVLQNAAIMHVLLNINGLKHDDMNGMQYIFKKPEILNMLSATWYKWMVALFHIVEFRDRSRSQADLDNSIHGASGKYID